nr:MAG TPA: hypothetical protein [Caudoviricetes sp.]
MCNITFRSQKIRCYISTTCTGCINSMYVDDGSTIGRKGRKAIKALPQAGFKDFESLL